MIDITSRLHMLQKENGYAIKFIISTCKPPEINLFSYSTKISNLDGQRSGSDKEYVDKIMYTSLY